MIPVAEKRCAKQDEHTHDPVSFLISPVWKTRIAVPKVPWVRSVFLQFAFGALWVGFWTTGSSKSHCHCRLCFSCVSRCLFGLCVECSSAVASARRVTDIFLFIYIYIYIYVMCMLSFLFLCQDAPESSNLEINFSKTCSARCVSIHSSRNIHICLWVSTSYQLPPPSPPRILAQIMFWGPGLHEML